MTKSRPIFPSSLLRNRRMRQSAVPSSLLVFLNPRVTGLMLGSNIAGHTRLFAQVRERLGNVIQGPVIVVSASEISNLQSLLKKVVPGCLQIDLEEDEDEPIKVSSLILGCGVTIECENAGTIAV
jgi:Origin recognition complex (ORC) subunit 3 N-terminus